MIHEPSNAVEKLHTKNPGTAVKGVVANGQTLEADEMSRKDKLSDVLTIDRTVGFL